MRKKRLAGGLGPLSDGGRVVVIGGGPGGTGTALALHAEARRLGRNIQITVVEGKQIEGEIHHNLCSGVLSPPVMTLMENELEVPFPHYLCSACVNGYVLHANNQKIILDGEGEPSAALRRIKFDAYMLHAVRQHNITVHTARATGVEFHHDRVIVYTDNAPITADVVIGAFGLDEGTGALFRDAVGYRLPPALSSIVTKYHPGEEAMQAFGKRVHAFLPRSQHIEFGGITPKEDHLTINIAGIAVNVEVMDEFLTTPMVQDALPAFENARRFKPLDLRYFKGRFPCGLAGNYTGDRFVMVGDAAGLVRAFKGKGVTSAIQTGLRAARVILQDGISADAFRAYHAANQDITSDLPFGRAMRFLTITAARLGLMGVIIRAAQDDFGLQRALFDAVSAHHSYTHVVRNALTLKATKAILGAFLTSERN